MMCFSLALEAMKCGLAVCRNCAGWDDGYGLLIKSDRREEGDNFYIQSLPPVGYIGIRFYQLTHNDILATDWRIIE